MLVFQLGSSPWGGPPFMFASAGMLIPEGAISWVFQAEEKKEKKERHGGFANGKRKLSTLVHRRVGLERKMRGGEKK